MWLILCFSPEFFSFLIGYNHSIGMKLVSLCSLVSKDSIEVKIIVLVVRLGPSFRILNSALVDSERD